MKITKDNTVFKIVNDEAKDLFNLGVFNLCILNDDNVEFWATEIEDIVNALKSGLDVGIEVGKLPGNKVTENLQKELEWYKAFCDQVQATNHRAYEYACEHADSIIFEYPYEEGDTYWVFEPIDEQYEDNNGFFQRGVIAVQSCWDDVSEELHRENLYKDYFDSIEEVLAKCRDTYDFIKVECFDCDMEDITDGDYLVCEEESGKFKKSY